MYWSLAASPAVPAGTFPRLIRGGSWSEHGLGGIMGGAGYVSQTANHQVKW
jgi:hypothetical protein